MRPARLIFVTGTATEIGKTWVAAQLLGEARRQGMSVAARKPLQSFEPGDDALDSRVLADASGEPATTVCPDERSYPVPMAPPMAAAALGRAVPSVAQLAGLIDASWPAGGDEGRERGVDLGLVEGAGGVASPLASDGDSAGLARRLGVDRVVLVADAELGAINSVRLSVAGLRPLPVVVHLNLFDDADDLHRRNREWLTERDGFNVTTSVALLLTAVSAL